MINQIEYNYNLKACYEDKVLDWKMDNVYSYWNKLFHFERDLEEILDTPLIHEATERSLS
jgi:hypothetical protein